MDLTKYLSNILVTMLTVTIVSDKQQQQQKTPINSIN